MEDMVMKRQSVFALVAGVLFGAGWWIFIDGYSMGVNVIGDDCAKSTAGYAWLPLFGQTLAYIMINGMKWSELSDEYVNDPRTAVKARIFLVFALLIAMVCAAGSAFVMAEKFLRVPECAYKWSGISCFVGTMVLLLATWVQRFGTLPPAGGSF